MLLFWLKLRRNYVGPKVLMLGERQTKVRERDVEEADVVLGR